MKLKVLAGALTLALGSTSAMAAAIIGDIAFSQKAGTTVSPVGGSLATATGFTFTVNNLFGSNNTNMMVVNSTGTFVTEGVVAGSFGVQNNFTFSPSTPVDPLWTVAPFSFAATSFSIVSQSAAGVVLSGKGNISAAGYETTAGVWDFSVQQTGTQFSWSSSAAAVPLPATVGLIGLGLAAVGAVSRRRVAA